MANEGDADNLVGPVMRTGDMADAVIEAIREDNEGREVIVVEHASYLRIKVADVCVLRYETVGEMLGRDVTRGDIEASMPSFAGFIHTEPDGIRFVAKN
jgi:toluene monooxygenase system protein D